MEVLNALRHMVTGVIVTGETHWNSEMKTKVQQQKFDSTRIEWEYGIINQDNEFISIEKK